MADAAAARRRSVTLWLIAFAAVGAALAARNLTALATAPPGMYVDEASIGYNAWALAHFGVDEHGYHLPLYFEAFGEYKNPVYVYALVPFLRWLPLTATVERLPAAIFGAVTVVFITLAAWRVTRSRALALFVMVLASLTPWITQESRVGFEVVSMLATLSISVWCLAGETTPRRFAAAGCLLALSIVAYSAGRVEVALFTLALLLTFRRHRGVWLALVPVGAMYAVVGVWAAMHPGALTAEFSVVSIGAGGAPLTALPGRFLANYVQYFSPDFLFVHGDPNLRHNTGYAGMLLAVMAPLLLAGLWQCWRRRASSLPRFTVLCLALAPVSGALTYPAPHALRGAAMVPFLFLLAGLGLQRLGELVRAAGARRALAAVLTGGLLAQGTLYLVDLYTAYPTRSAAWFDAGAVAAVATAHTAAGGHRVLLSNSIDEAPYIDAFVALLPRPPASPEAQEWPAALQELGMTVADSTTASAEAAPGDVLVFSAGDARPAGTTVVAVERAPRDPLASGPPPALLVVYRAV